MSNTSIDREQSPTIQTVQHGGDKCSGSGAPPARAEAQASTDATAPQMNYPIDQDLFDSRPPSQPHLPANHETAEAVEPAYLEPTEEELLPPPDFKPFFTLISDPGAGEHHHPTVHYLFSDDDQEILTSAALDALESSTGEDAGADIQGRGGEEDEEHVVEERVVIIDIAADGKSVTNIVSLSKDWQALKTEVGAAPSMGNATQEGGERGLMLKILGKEAGDAGNAESRRRVGDGGLEGLVAEFGEVLGGLDEVVGKGEGLGQAERVENEEGEGKGEASLT